MSFNSSITCIVVIGLGSMGKRRIRLLREFDSSFILIGVDSSESRRNEVESSFNMEVFASLDEALARHNLSVAFVCTGPEAHARIITQSLSAGLHVFTEINLIDSQYDENIELARQKGKVLFLSSTGMYRSEVAYIKSRAQSCKKTGGYRYHVGQYLPDWHPWEDYRKMFLANKKTNACREILAVELPWITDAFGDVVSFHSYHKKVSDLDVAYDDLFQIILEHETGIIGSFTVEVVSRTPTRKFEYFNEELQILWDGTPTGLMSYDLESGNLEKIDFYEKERPKQISSYANYVIENAYFDEVKNFFGVIRGAEKPRHTFEKDKRILELISRIGA